MPANRNRHTNYLAGESSVYLLSHANNPVNWYPWGKEALRRAKEEDKPIFLSVGYAACHWCHVMEQESFENETIAAALNEHFVSIKVDREQRPDLDQIYMNFTTALTGQGGWPMSVFLTPDLKPFFAGTYFPPDDRYGRPGFLKVVTEIARAYTEEKDTIVRSSEDIFDQISTHLRQTMPSQIIATDSLAGTAAELIRTFDQTYGGFGSAPKFPHALELSLLMRAYKAGGVISYLQATEKALKAMARGGIFDHLAGGFARYSTDHKWLVPHFEKMLYDNALLVPTYVEAYQLTGDSFYRDILRQTLDFVLNEMTDPSGGFYSSLDADSEGEEGKFYVWSKDEIDAILGDDAHTFSAYYNVTAEGNFEGKNILHLTAESDRVRDAYDGEDFDRFIASSRQKLLKARSSRVRPLTDDKILTSWNGLMLTALCRGYQVTGDKRYRQAAVANAQFVRKTLYREGRLTHAYRDGVHSEGEFLEDYAYYVAGLLDLYETDDSADNNQWLSFARQLATKAVDLFSDSHGRFFLRPEGHDDLIIRPANESDSATPAPGSILIAALLKLNSITGEDSYLETARKGLRALAGLIQRYPGSMASTVMAADYLVGEKLEIVIVGNGDERDLMLHEVYSRFLPNRIIAVSDDGADGAAIFRGREPVDGKATAYVCRNSTCGLPATSAAKLRDQLGNR